MQMHSRMPSLIPWFYCQKKSFSWRKTWHHLEHFQTSVSTSDCSTIIMHCPRWQRVRSTRKRRRHLRQPASLLLAGRLTVSCFKNGHQAQTRHRPIAVRHPSARVCIGPVYWSGRFFTFWAKGNTTPLLWFMILWFYSFLCRDRPVLMQGMYFKWWKSKHHKQTMLWPQNVGLR